MAPGGMKSCLMTDERRFLPSQTRFALESVAESTDGTKLSRCAALPARCHLESQSRPT